MADLIVVEKEVVITEPEKAPEPNANAPTREELKAKGWNAADLESAEKRGMIKAEEDAAGKAKAEEAKAAKEKSEAEAKTKAEADAKAGVDDEKKPEGKSRGSVPDFTFKTPEQEKVFLDAFGAGTPQRAMYFRMKNERQSRQAAEQRAQAAELRAKDYEERLKTLEAGKTTQELDEDGNPIDPEDKPLTLKDLKALQTKAIEEQTKKRTEMDEHARIVADAQVTQEEYARSIYPDFDETVEKAKEVMKNLDTLLPEKWQQAKAIKLIRDLQVAAAKADRINVDEYHAAMIAYEIGQMHPKYGKPAADVPAKPNGDASDKDGNSKDPKKANGGHTPEQMKRIEENTQRRASSASVPGGGGKRTISVDDVDLATLNKMNYRERQTFRDKHPDQYAKLQRG